MKILLVHNYYQSRSGEETYFDSLVYLLKKEKHEVLLYTRDSGKISGTIQKIQIIFNLLFGYRTKRELKNIITTFRPDIVHFNNIYPLIGQAAYTVCSDFSVPIVQTVHNYRPMCIKGHLFRTNKICELCIKASPLNGVLYKCFQNSYVASFFLSLHMLMHRYMYKTHNTIDVFIFPSVFTQRYFLTHFPISKKNTHILPYYIDKISLPRKKSDKGEYYLYFGRLSEEKGIREIVDIFKELPKMRLIIAGDGPLKKYVLENTKAYGNILYIGHQGKKNLVGLINDAFCVIINSLWYEVLPYSMLEAIAMKRNVFIRNNINLGSFIINKDCLFASQKELKSKIITFSEHKINKYKENYHKNIQQSYHKKALLKLYSDLINKKHQ